MKFLNEKELISYYDIIIDNGKLKYNTLTRRLSLNATHKNYIFSDLEKEKIHELTVKEILYEINSCSVLTLRVVGTYVCNARCQYCYQNHLPNETKHISIDVNALVTFIKNYIKNNHISTIQFFWYGGEPLCYIDKIIEINRLVRRTILSNIKIYNDISTNGYALSESILKKCSELENLSFSISIEPTEIIQNMYRPSLLKVSYDKLLENISRCSNDYITTIVFVLSYKNFYEIFNFTDTIIKANMNIENLDVFIGKLTDIENCLPMNLKKQLVRLDHFIQMRNICYLNFKKHGMVFSNTRLNPFNTGCNYFIRNSFVILPNGDISKCHEHTTNSKHIVGKIQSFVSYNPYEDTFIECKGCKLLPVCKGGCVDRFLNKGRRACIMKTIDGIHFKNFNTSIIDEAFRMMLICKNIDNSIQRVNCNGAGNKVTS